MTKVVAVIQARMGSTRLPGKVLMDLGGQPVLAWCVRAAKAAPGVDTVWVATSTLDQDDVIAQWCADNEVHCWRGSETDVLSRFVGCANASGADVLLRITADCPMLDSQVIGAVVRLQKQTGAAYCSNVSPRSYPDGLDVEAFTYEALAAADAEATRPIDRDCVTTWIGRNRSRFPAETVINPIPGLETERWVLDTAADYEFCKNVAVYWPWDKGPPSQLDILGILDANPDIRELNADAIMNERYFDALAEEPIYARSYERSQAQFEKAREVIPLAAQTFSKSHLQYPQPSPLFLSHGQGGLVYDVDGSEYVDLVSALLPNILGYRDHDVDAAIRRQLASGISFSLATELEAELAETLCRIIPCAEAVRFGKSGTDVTTAAIRVARAFTGRDRVLICGGYHGWQDWSIERNLGVPNGVQALTTRISSGDVEAAEAALPAVAHPACKYAAVIIEPECGAPFLRLLRELCDRSGTVLIFDEIITGFRYHLGGAQAMYGVTPDLATFGKAMANGMPLSAIVGRKDIMKRFEPPDNVFYSGTMFGETLSLAASLATIRKMEREDVVDGLRKKGLQLMLGVQDLMKQHGISEDIFKMHGVLSFLRIKFGNDQIAALFRKEMIASGTLIVGSHNLCHAMGESEIRRVLKSYDHTFAILRDALDKGDIAERLAGATVAPMVRAS
jgi:glutamate-1-semialdehyde aminotransferase/spore coat polysaccharide biosynthesis protein SpsF (cytidylyltransferase family)